MFVNNKYQSWYINIIASAQGRELPKSTYGERHHILPKSLGGPDTKWNIVKLTGKEHFIVHKLLTKFTVGPAYYKMMHALWRMVGRKDTRDRHKVSASEYERIKSLNARAMSEARKGKSTPARIEAAAKRRGIPAHNKGVSMKGESKIKMIQTRSLKNQNKEPGHKLNLSPEQREKRSNLLALHRTSKREQPFPKFRYVLQNLNTQITQETTHLKKWIKSQGLTDPQFYSPRCEWKIVEKYRLKTGERLI
jgi:hypothetical protein